MANGMGDYEVAIAPVKRELFGSLMSDLLARRSDAYTPRLLELGIGTGPNFAYYAEALQQAQAQGAAAPSERQAPDTPTIAATASSRSTISAELPATISIVGVDPNPEMLTYAKHSARRAGLAGPALELQQGSADALPFADASFDAAVITLVLCSVPDPVGALREVSRVVKPGGRVLLIEHVAAPAGRPGLRLTQTVLNPLQRLLADGCNLNRDTLAAVREAGFGVAGVRQFEVDGFALIAPHIAGLLSRPALAG